MRYSQATKRYQLAVTDRDSADATTVTPAGPPSMPSPNTENSGDHLTTLAYDAVFGEVKLYVNGQLSGIGTLWPNAWDLSSVSIQVGRSLTSTTGSEYFSGALGEVSACSEVNGGVPTCA